MSLGSSGQIPPPHVLSMGICDLIHRDQETGKRFILGCFSVLHTAEIPAVHPAIGVYLDITNGRGTVTIRVRIVDSDEEREPIFSEEHQVEFSDPRMVAELDINISDLVFPEPGDYRVQAFAANEFLMERRLVVNQLESMP